MATEQDNPRKGFENYLRYSSLGIQMIGAILVPAWLGSLIDRRIGSHMPYVTLVFMLLGVIASIWILIKNLRKNG